MSAGWASSLRLVGRDAIETRHGSDDEYCEVGLYSIDHTLTAAWSRRPAPFAYRELEREHPRAVVGLTDISARQAVRPSLGKHVMSFTAPWPVFQRMEDNVENSFLQRETWQLLRGACEPR